MAAEGAGFFCVLSNENYYSAGAELDQMLAMSVFRAMETGRPFLRSTTNGLTVHIMADGRVVRALPPWERGSLVTTLRSRHGVTLAMQTGPWLHWLFFGGLLFWALFGKRRGASANTPRGV